jgi:tape measure domain-containing protein
MSFQVKIVYDLIDKVSSKIQKINSTINASAGNIKAMSSSMSQSFSSFSNSLNNNSNQIANSLNKVGSSLKEASGKLAPLSLGIGAIGFGALKSTANFETLAMQLESLAGSAEKGKIMFNNLVKLGAETPFELAPLIKANNTMMGFGLSSESAFANLKRIGDVAAITGGDLQGVALAFSQTSAQGRLMGQEILQFINNGVPIIEMLAKTMNRPTSEIKKLVEQGKVSFPIVEKAFIDATSQGGKFSDGMKKLSGTLSGIFSTLKDNVNIALADLGKDIVETTNLKQTMRDFAGFVADLTDKFKSLSPELKQFIIYGGMITVALTPILFIAGSIASGFAIMFKGVVMLTTGFSLLQVALAGAFRALIAFSVANPFTAILVATTLIYQYWGDITSIFGRVSNFIKQITFDDFIVAGEKILQVFSNIFKTILDILGKVDLFSKIGQIFSGTKDFIFGNGEKSNQNTMQPKLQSSNQNFNGNIAVSFNNTPKNTTIQSMVDNRAVDLGINSVFATR